MESPLELLAALPALITALALLFAWLLLRRGAARAPESTTRAGDPGAPAPPEPPKPCALEPPSVGPCQFERVAEPEEEEPEAEGRQVCTEVAVGSPGGHLRAGWSDLPRKGRASGRQERRVPEAGTLPPPQSASECRALELPSLPPSPGPPGPPKALDSALLLHRFCPPLLKSTDTCPTSRSELELAYS